MTEEQIIKHLQDSALMLSEAANALVLSQPLDIEDIEIAIQDAQKALDELYEVAKA